MHSEPMAVIINTCNRMFMLSALVDNVKEQMQEDDAIIIVNDGKEESVDEFRDVDVHVIEHCKPYYAVASGRNAGVEKAIDLGYEWGLFLDDDILLKDGCLDQHKKRWDNKKALYTGKIVSNNSGDRDIRTKIENPMSQSKLMFEDKDIEDAPLNLGGGANLSLHFPTLLNYNGFDESCDGNWGYEDTELYQRLSNQGWDIKYLEDAVVEHRFGPKGASYYKRGDSTNMSKASGHMNCFGLRATQKESVVPYMTTLLLDTNPDQIIELGTGRGGLSVLLGIWGLIHGIDVATYDIEPSELEYVLNRVDVDYSVANIFDNDVRQEIESKIEKEGKTLLISDNGDRAKEFKVFTKYLKEGDYVIVHDYAKNEKSKKDLNWSHFPVTFNDLNDVCEERDLKPINRYDLTNIGWGVFKR